MTNKTPKTADLVTVEWQDILFNDKWDDNDDSVQPVECVTVGWLIHEDKTMVTIASSYDYRSQTWATVHSFPKALPATVAIKKGGK